MISGGEPITTEERLLIEAAVALFYSCGDIGLPSPMENLEAAVNDYLRSITTDRGTA